MGRVTASKAELERMYVKKRMPIAAIAADLGCAPMAIWTRLVKFGIPTRRIWSADIGKQELEAMYIKKDMNQVMIAKELGTSPDTVRRRLFELGIGLKRSKQGVIELKKRDLERMYVKKKMTIRDIAAEFDVSFGVVQRNLLRHGIPLGKAGVKPIPIKKEVLEEAYARNGTITKTAEEFGCASATIKRKLVAFGIKHGAARRARGSRRAS